MAQTVTTSPEGRRRADQRLARVMALPEAEGREALAEHLAIATTFPIKQVRATLAAAPVLNATVRLTTEIEVMADFERITGFEHPFLLVLRDARAEGF